MLRRVSLIFVLGAIAASCASTTDDGTVTSAVVNADTLVHVRVTDADPELTSRRLLDEGFDVVEGSAQGTTLEVIGSSAEIDRLRALGYVPQTLAISAPFEGKTEIRSGYRKLDEMLATMREIETRHPTLAKVVDLTAKYDVPPTSEGRHLFALKVSAGVAHDADKPTFLLVSNHHARELGTPLVAMRTMEFLTNGYATDARIKTIVDANEIWIAPTWNPDGLEHVHNASNMWRKNRRPNGGNSFGVDQNRNYPFQWTSSCSGSSSKSSETYKGPTAASEPETQTMMAFSNDRHFTKVLDFHSSGREVLANYACSNNPLAPYLGELSKTLATTMGYGGHTRRPSGQGEHQDWQAATMSSLSFLVEINTTFQPPFAAAQAEVEQLLPGILWHLELPVPVTGHVRDAATGAPLAANLAVREIAFTQGERNTSGGTFGRFQAFLPPGTYTFEVSAPGYRAETKSVTIVDTPTTLDVGLTKL